MYTLNVTNNYAYPVKTSQGQEIPPNGGTLSLTRLGSLYMNIPGNGDINFIDLGSEKLPDYPMPNQTWGVLVRVHTQEAYYRYEGGGELSLTIDKYGSTTLTSTNGDMITVQLPELTIKQE
ncbi:hypothetical protein SAMN06298216_4295 [Spirosomataceae bacterium TFI 002]|nr:hypothetical protein SAMN06298216_4295 [Spirosomataceae bacterium TFI 002]